MGIFRHLVKTASILLSLHKQLNSYHHHWLGVSVITHCFLRYEIMTLSEHGHCHRIRARLLLSSNYLNKWLQFGGLKNNF
ncbi:TPA: hypothetical protein AB5E57_003005, partial [Vibrio cholerae]